MFPALAGLKWDIGSAPSFKTRVQRAVSGRELRAALMQYPTWTFKLGYEFLRDGVAGSDLNTLRGFFLARQGSFDSFLYSAPSDNAVTAMSFGTGDGATTVFQLTRALGAGGFAFVEPVQNLNGTPSIYKDGVLQTSGVTIGATGLVTFAAAPTAGQSLTWTGNFYYRCRFKDDSADFEQFMQDLWSLKKLEFIGAPGNRV